MSRHRILSLVLTCLVMLSQNIAIAHVMSHALSDISSPAHDQHLPSHATCAQCLALNAVGAGLPFTLFDIPTALPSDRITFLFLVIQFTPPAFDLFEARAPPA